MQRLGQHLHRRAQSLDFPIVLRLMLKITHLGRRRCQETANSMLLGDTVGGLTVVVLAFASIQAWPEAIVHHLDTAKGIRTLEQYVRGVTAAHTVPMQSLVNVILVVTWAM